MSTKLKQTLLAASSLALVCAVYGMPASAQTNETAPAAQQTEQPAAEAAEQPATEQPAAEQPAPAEQPAAEAEEKAEDKPAEVAAANPSDPAPENAEKAVAEIPAPANEVEKAAFAALEKHCSRCHQDGKLENRVKPASGFGNVLHLSTVAKNPSLVIAGNPDGSELIKQIASGNMPYDIKDGSNFLAPTPTETEIAAIRTWITSLKDTASAACGGRDFVDNEKMVSAIADDLDKEPDHRVKGMRYVALTHLYNACASDAEMNVFRQAVVKLLNSLSTNSDVLTLKTADKAGAIVKFHLDDLKWTEADWEKIVKAYPYAVKPDVDKYDYVTGKVSTKVPYVRGDWLAFTASRPQLYYDLLKMPANLNDLEKGLGLNVAENIEKFLVKRAASQRSLVSQNNRLIERHTISTGYFWTSYDFAGNKGNQSLFEHPLGPKGENAFKHDGGETIYSLPNGFQAYYLNKADGARLDKGPTEIVRDKDRKDLAVTNGISCMGCHDQGIRLYTDQIRNHVVNDRNFSKETRETVEALYPVQEDLDKIFKEDTDRFQGAMRKAGLDPALKLDGIEIINALSNHYERDINLAHAASEFGLKTEAFEQAASDVGGDPKTLLRRLQQAVVPRDNFESQFSNILKDVTDDEMVVADAAADAAKAEVAKVNEGDAKVDGKTTLTLIADKTDYNIDDKPIFIVQSDSDCSLTLINVDGKGTGTVLFPNKFQQDAFIKAKQAFEFPAPDAPFQFRMKDPGVETVIALCNPKAKTRSVDQITHNFDSKAFTDLGEYEKFSARAIAVEVAEVKKEAVEAKKEAPKAETENNIASRSGVARAAIKVTVK